MDHSAANEVEKVRANRHAEICTDRNKADSSLAKTALEQRYIQLLELRVAQLETIVSQGESKVSIRLCTKLSAH